MGTDDLLLISLGVNIGLLVWNHRLTKHNEKLAEVVGVFSMAIKDAASNKIRFVRTDDGITLEKLNGN